MSCSKEAGGPNRGGVPAGSVDWILFCKISVLRSIVFCSKEAGGPNRGGAPAGSVGWILFCKNSVLHFWWSASVWVGIGCSEHLYPYYNTAGPMPHGLWVLSVAGRFDASSRVRARGASTVARDYGRVLAGLGRGTSPSPRVVFDRAKGFALIWVLPHKTSRGAPFGDGSRIHAIHSITVDHDTQGRQFAGITMVL